MVVPHALQASDAIHLGVDNLNVVRQVGRLLDCDLIMLIGRILEQREEHTVRVTKVKGHADEEKVRVGQVRELDKLGKSWISRAHSLFMMNQERICYTATKKKNTQSLNICKVFGITRKIHDDFHDCVRNVSFPRKLGTHRFSKKVTISDGNQTKHKFYKRESTNKNSLKSSLSFNNYCF